MSLKFYKCNHCGQVIEVINNKGIPIICCGEKMAEIVPCTVDASREKHIPVYEKTGNKLYICVGSVEHPATIEHLIEWVCVETDKGIIRVNLEPDHKPEVVVNVEGYEVKSVYAYCNLHGLWKA